MSHSHSHGHGHSHAPTNYNRAFGVGVALNVGYVICEAAFGFATNSLSLLADAGHNAGDVLGLLLAWGGYALTKIEPSERRTYGWRGSSILAALFNALILLAAVGGIAWEAVRRFQEPQPVGSGAMIWVAAVGVAVNALTAFLFFSGRKSDLNLRGAFLHMAADAGVSVGVVVAGLLILWTGKTWIDPVTSLLVAAVIFLSTWGLLRDSVNLAMHAVPAGIDPAAVRDYLKSRPGVTELHDLHIWAMSTTEPALTAHLVKPDAGDDDRFLSETAGVLHDRFGIEHVTLQIERRHDTALCKQANPKAV